MLLNLVLNITWSFKIVTNSKTFSNNFKEVEGVTIMGGAKEAHPPALMGTHLILKIGS